MRSFKKTVILATVVTLGIAVGGSRAVGAAYSRTQTSGVESLLQGQADIAKAAAAWVTAQAAVIKAQAEANATNAQAMETYQKARSLTLDNDLKAAKTFYEKRQMRETYGAMSAPTRATREDLIRYSKASTPERPTSYQLEPVRGKIYWPTVLQGESFLEERVQLESLFAKRKTLEGGVSSPVFGEVQGVAEEMRTELRSKMREISPVEYLAARKFIDALAFEARFPQQMKGVASK